MNQLSNVSKVVVVAVIAAVLIILTIVYGTGGNQNTALNNDSSTAGASVTALSPTQTPAGAQPAAQGGNAGVATSHSESPAIKFITPVQGDIWKIGTQNVISWNTEGGISGDIYLVNSATNEFVGVILPQVGPHQTSYTWNTRDVLIDRTNPLKKDITPGTYVIKIAYDGNNIPITTTPAFTITN